MELLRRMLDDPARARVMFIPPEPLSVLRSPLDRTNIRSLLVHAADLAECLNDASVLTQAQQKAKEPCYDSSSEIKGHSGLTYLLGNARYRLMIEQIGNDLLTRSAGLDAARFLQDTAVEEDIRRKWEWFEDERREWSRSRGELGDPKTSQSEARAAEHEAWKQLNDRLPGITKDRDECKRLMSLLKKEINEILSGERLADWWQYIFLKHFSAYPDMAYALHDRDRTRVRKMLEVFEATNKTQLP